MSTTSKGPSNTARPTKKFIVDYTMVRQCLVTVGSVWDYGRQLDNAQNYRNLVVKSIANGQVEFEQKMPFKTYGIGFFDGRIFKLVKR